MLLENLRFHAEEEKNDPAFAKQLAELADVYVNDAFGSAHRAHASTEGIVHHVKEAAAGLLMGKEVEYLGRVLENPERPFVAVLGGAKVSDKLEVIENLIAKVDALLIGGAMAYTFLEGARRRGRQVAGRGRPARHRARRRAARQGARPAPRAAGRSRRRAEARSRARRPRRSTSAIPSIGDRMGLDIGPKTDRDLPVGDRRREDRRSGTARWACSRSTRSRRAPSKSPRPWPPCKGTTVIGGGDSIAAVAKAGVTDKITHISTGGGASLEFLGGRTLPGVAALE